MSSSQSIPASEASGIAGPVLRLLPIAMREKRLLAWSTLLGLFYYLSIIAASGLGAYIIGLAATGASSDALTGRIVLLAGVVLLAAALIWGWMALIHDYAYAILAQLRIQMFDGLIRLAPRFVLGKRTGDIGSVIMSDVEVTERFFAHTIADYAIALLIAICAAVALAWIHPLLALVFLITAALISSVPFWLARLAERQGQRTRGELGTLTADVIDGIQGMRDLVAFGQANAFAKRLEQRTVNVGQSQLAYGRRVGLEAGISDALQAAAVLAIVAVAAWLVSTGAVGPALYPVAVVLIATSLAPVAAVAQVARELGDVNASARRMLGISERAMPVQSAETGRIARPQAWPISFESVSFAYDDKRGRALDGATFNIANGETVALVGRSGAGKSTCANLLLRLWEVDGGAIKIEGRDIRTWSENELRELIAVVPQDVYLFNTTIRENIRLGRPDATDQEVEAAARVAQIHDFIVSELPNGYDTICGERALALSGGQRQRIAIARAVVKQAPIMLMDEAVSNLDSESERALRIAMTEASRGRTTIIIAHRLVTVQSADRVVVLDRGRCVQSGMPETLAAQPGAYADLFGNR
jgi:ABC-type multidrug transport system fused ATPase/permease subunit